VLDYARILPIPNPDSVRFWEGCKKEILLIQQCENCGKYRYEPRAVCPYCLSSSVRWAESDGKGKVYSFVIYRYAPAPKWTDEVPYVVALIELKDCSVRMVSNIINCAPEEVKIGMDVVACFEKATEEITLVKFRPLLLEKN